MMKKTISALLSALLVLSCAGCGQSSSSAGTAASPASVGSAAASGAGSSAGSAESSADGSSTAVDNLNSPEGALVIESQDCFDSAYLFQPEQDGTYHFCAQTADSFVGSDVGYAGDSISWTIYVLEEEFEDGWRYLSQAFHPYVSGLTGSTDLPLKTGQYVYCVCDLNGFTSEAAADGAGALSITLTSDPYGPGENNNYQLDISLGSESLLDLDGDGQEDTIYYNVTQEAVSNDLYEAPVPESLSINGTDYLSSDSENPLSDYGVWLENPGGTGKYYLVDLDTSDPWREIALVDAGSSDWRTTHYFRYDGSSLTYLGYMTGFPDDQSTVYHGDGSVTAESRLDLLQTWYGPRTFRLTDNNIRMVDGEFFTPIQPEDRKVSLLRELTAYTEPDQSSAQVTLSPSTALSFLSTDGTHWLQIQCADGSTGWVYFSSFSTVEADGQTFEAEDLFGNLTLAS